jgi:hypothetical protein
MSTDIIGKTDTLLTTRQNTAGSSDLGGIGTFVSLTSVSGTYGAWVQVVASTASDLLVTSFAVVTNTVPGITEFPILLGVGIGASGSEVSVLEQPCATAAAAVTTISVIAPPVRIAAGQRVSARIYNGSSSGTVYRVALFTVPYASLDAS